MDYVKREFVEDHPWLGLLGPVSRVILLVAVVVLLFAVLY